MIYILAILAGVLAYIHEKASRYNCSLLCGIMVIAICCILLRSGLSTKFAAFSVTTLLVFHVVHLLDLLRKNETSLHFA